MKCGYPEPRGLIYQRRQKMSCDKWAYDPKVCDDQVCPGDCDFCDLWMDDEEEKEIEQEILAARKGEE